MSSEASQRAAAMRNTSIVGILVNAFLTVIKILFGIIGQSHSLVSDGIHSLADISTTMKRSHSIFSKRLKKPTCYIYFYS